MAYEFYVKVTGTKQGAFKGETPREAFKDKMSGLSFHYNLKSPRDAATGQASGKRTHGAVQFVKEWGPSSPQFFQALCTNEILKEVTFDFVKTNANGEEYVYHTIKLTNATVSEVDQYLLGDAKQDQAHDVHELEKISFTFQKIEMENKDGKTMALDDWHSK